MAKTKPKKKGPARKPVVARDPSKNKEVFSITLKPHVRKRAMAHVKRAKKENPKISFSAITENLWHDFLRKIHVTK